jgi:hypothetical protein
MGESGPVLSRDAAQALACVLDEIIPRSDDGALPGAGELGLVAAIERALIRTPDLKVAVDAGLAALERQALERGAASYPALPRAERREILDAVVGAQPAFLPGLVFHSYTSYYQHPRVLEALGLEPRPPFPRGYAVQAGDFGLLDAVRRRRRIYREC